MAASYSRACPASLENLKNWLRGRTLVATTNRPGLLELFDRIVLIDNGRITPDGPKDRVLAVSLREIAPPEKQLPIEACMSPCDIAFIPAGRPLTVKITPYDPSICGTRAGTL